MVQSEAARLTRQAAGYGSGFVLIVCWVWLFAAENSTSGAVLMGLGAVFAVLAMIYVPRALWAHAMGVSELQAIAATEGLTWRHFYKGTGIALDPEQRRLHLFGAGVYRCYALSQVRTWQRRHQTGGGVYGGGVAGVAANLDNLSRNAASSGLFVEVRDLDHPVWRIAFPPRTLQRELPRWMEILQQSVNEGQVK